MEEIKKIIVSNRPHIGENSVKSYLSVIKNLYLKIAEKTDFGNAPEFFEKEYEKVIKYLTDTFPFSTRKTKLASLVVLMPDGTAKQEYQKQMLVDIKSYNELNEKQEKSDKQVKGWQEQKEILAKVTLLKKKTKPLFEHPTLKDLDAIQDYIIACLYTSIPPRRLLDYTEFKIRDIDAEKDNYMSGDKFVFNVYKTAKKYQRQEVPIPKSLRILIQKWTKLHDHEYLLFDTKNGNKLSSPTLNKKMNDIFGVSVNMLRSIYISDKIDMPKMKYIDNIAEEMGTSSNMMINHYKKF
jgi:hypothetical protein